MLKTVHIEARIRCFRSLVIDWLYELRGMVAGERHPLGHRAGRLVGTQGANRPG